MTNVLIVGYGVVGQNLSKELHRLNPDVYDKFKSGYSIISDKKYDLIFICVDTPKTEETLCDISSVQQAILENQSRLSSEGIVVIKSTILPLVAQLIEIECKVPIVFSPEYYGATPHSNGIDFGFTILGGEKDNCIKVQQLMQPAYNASHVFKIVDTKTAMLAKYMENSWLATKVSFCNQFYEIAKSMGVYYEDLRELFILDPRVNPSHTYVFREHPYWDSHCLNKDVSAIAETSNAELLKNIIEFNNKQKCGKELQQS